MSLNKGFTLVEILLPALIIGIIAGTALPSYSRFIQKAENTKIILQLDSLGKELQAYQYERGLYPKDLKPGQSPSGINQWPTDSAVYDYEHWGVGDGACSVVVTYYGQDKIRQSPIHINYGQAGSISQDYGDDIAKVVSVYPCNHPVGSISS
ncbi:MAG: prepilin-type N-terminal cleavage/methylation domain-containing protein [Cyanobacteria bacterium RI_101]|nr:prepilin-type N-terminal cleavage/methylation domain-containing protein [Cyanobacteria bacterium RI_101]